MVLRHDTKHRHEIDASPRVKGGEEDLRDSLPIHVTATTKSTSTIQQVSYINNAVFARVFVGELDHLPFPVPLLVNIQRELSATRGRRVDAHNIIISISSSKKVSDKVGRHLHGSRTCTLLFLFLPRTATVVR